MRYSRGARRASTRRRATPIASFDNREPSRTRFGALEFRGGLALTSTYEAFGGISALRMEPDGSHFLSVTDNGSWLRGRILYRDGKPAGIADAEMAPMLGPDGGPLAARGWYDAESLAELDGTLYVGIERVEKIVRFDYAPRRPRGARRADPGAGRFQDLHLQQEPGVPGGAAQGLAARRHADRRSPSAASTPPAITALTCSTASRSSASASSAATTSTSAIAPSCRRPICCCSSAAIRWRAASPCASAASRSPLKPGALVDGAPLIVADLGYQIDNMEGIAVHRNARGETILTLVSDDNFSVLQRNLLLQFALVGESAPQHGRRAGAPARASDRCWACAAENVSPPRLALSSSRSAA